MPFPVVATGQYADASVSEEKLTTEVRTKLNRAAGEAVTYTLTLAEPLSAWTCVRTNADGLAMRCTNAAEHQQTLLGVTTQAGTAGEAVRVAVQGRVTDSSFTRFTPGAILFVGADGTLVNTPPLTGYMQVVGSVMASDELAIMPGFAILQE